MTTTIPSTTARMPSTTIISMSEKPRRRGLLTTSGLFRCFVMLDSWRSARPCAARRRSYPLVLARPSLFAAAAILDPARFILGGSPPRALAASVR